jgi:5'-3' exonuclease
MRAMLRGKFIALCAFIKKLERLNTSNLTVHLKALEQKEANTPKRNRQQKNPKKQKNKKKKENKKTNKQKKNLRAENLTIRKKEQFKQLRKLRAGSWRKSRYICIYLVYI